MLYDVVAPTLGGRDEEMIFSARLDNLAMSHAAIRAMIDAAPNAGAGELVPVAALFDHEEVGSETAYGAQSGFLPRALERIVLGPRRLARGLPPRARRLALRVRRHGACGSPELRIAPRIAAQARLERRAGREDQQPAALRDVGLDGGALPRSLRARRGARSSTTPTARTCRADRPSARSPRRSSASARSTSAIRCSACTRSASSAARRIPR